MSSSGWDQMADWWDKRLGDEGDLWHHTLIDPSLLRLSLYHRSNGVILTVSRKVPFLMVHRPGWAPSYLRA